MASLWDNENTPPLKDKLCVPTVNETNTARPFTRSRASVLTPIGLPSITAPLPTVRKSSRRKFEIFQDAVEEDSRPKVAPKKPKTTIRKPLSIRTDSGNTTPVPSPRAPDTPFPFSFADPLWENIENYDPRPYLTPPPTPLSTSRSPSPLGRPPSRHSDRPGRHQGVIDPLSLFTNSEGLTKPRNMALYELLELEDWNAKEKDIRAAWRSVAVIVHPDRVGEEDKEDATLKMQHLNAAKELLLDARRRRQYHANGVLPWVV